MADKKENGDVSHLCPSDSEMNGEGRSLGIEALTAGPRTADEHTLEDAGSFAAGEDYLQEEELEETFALDSVVSKQLEDIFYVHTSNASLMSREQFEVIVVESGLYHLMQSPDFHDQINDLYGESSVGAKTLDFPSFLQALGLLASLNYPQFDSFSDAMELLLKDHIVPVAAAKETIPARTTLRDDNRQRNTPAVARTPSRDVTGEQKRKNSALYMESPSDHKQKNQEEDFMSSQVRAEREGPSLHASRYFATNVTWIDPVKEKNSDNGFAGNIVEDGCGVANDALINRLEINVELPVGMRWDLRCIFSMYARLGGSMASKRSTTSGGAIIWPVVDVMRRKPIAKLKMSVQGFMLFIQDCGLIDVNANGEGNGPSTKSVNPNPSLFNVAWIEIMEIFDRVASSCREAAHGVPIRISSSSNTPYERQMKASSAWEALSRTTSSVSGTFLKTSPGNSFLRVQPSISEKSSLDFDGFVQAIFLLAQHIFIPGEIFSQSPYEYGEKRLKEEIMTAFMSLLNGCIFPGASRCEPPIPRLRASTVEKSIDGSSGEAVGLSKRLPISVDGFASSLLSLKRVQSGIRALYNYYSSPAATRLFKKVDAKTRTSNTKLKGKSSIHHESKQSLHSFPLKYRLASDQTSDDVDISVWYEAFSSLDVHKQGYLNTTHVILMLNRVGLTISSDLVTDWVRRVGGVRIKNSKDSEKYLESTGNKTQIQHRKTFDESEGDACRGEFVTFVEILAGWSSAHAGGTGHGRIVLDKSGHYTSNLRNNSRASSLTNTPVQSRAASPASFRGSPTLSTSGSVMSSTSMKTPSSFSKLGGASGRRSRYAPRHRGRFIGIDVGDFLEFVSDFNICPKLLPLTACRAIFTRRAASAAAKSFSSAVSQKSESSLQFSTRICEGNRQESMGQSAISVSCETFAALICDLAHVGFGTYPYDVAVSSFAEKFLVMLWHLQQCEKGTHLIGLKGSNLPGDLSLFGELPASAPTSVDVVRQKRRKKRPDLALQMLGSRMENALPHERQMWANISSPRSPGLFSRNVAPAINAVMKFKGLKKKSKTQSLSNERRKPENVSQRRSSTWGRTSRPFDYASRVAEKRYRAQMSSSLDWNGKPKRPLYNIKFDAQDVADSKAKAMGSSLLDADRTRNSSIQSTKRERSQPLRPRSTWAPTEKAKVRQYLAAPHKRFNMSIRQIIKQKKKNSLRGAEHSAQMTKQLQSETKYKSTDMNSANDTRNGVKNVSEPHAVDVPSEKLRAPHQEHGSAIRSDKSVPKLRMSRKTESPTENGATDDSFSGLEGELTDLMAELRNL